METDFQMLTRRRLLGGALAGVLVSGTAGTLLAGCGKRPTAASPQQGLADTPSLASVPNFRDVAGNSQTTTYHGLSGKVLQRGVWYRSGALQHLSDADAQTLASLNIRHVFDLRTPKELATKPSRPIAGATTHHHNFMGIDSATAGNAQTPQEMVAWMEETERDFVRNPIIRANVARILAALATAEGAALFHCSAGKDRSGWIAALLQLHAGMPEAQVFDDYLLSNSRMAESMATEYEQIAQARGREAADIYRPALGVQASYLRAGLDEMQSRYGSLDGYLRQGLELDAAVLQRLQERLLEPALA